MKITLVPGRELSDDLIRSWLALRQSNPDLTSPFFHPEFTRAVAAVRKDVETAVIEEAGRVAAFFPFQREGRDVAGPVGGIISDYQGLICAPDFICDPRDLIKACGLEAWHFDHLVAAQQMFTSFHRNLESSPVIDLKDGFESYMSTCHAARAERIKLRRMERDLGPVRNVSATMDGRLLDSVLEWKSAQYRQAKNPDLFAVKWVRAAVERIHATQTPQFAGVLSVLYAADVPVAGHFGMRSNGVWHYWFPSYAREYARYSPGLVLLLKMMEEAAGLGLHTIDLGKGKTLYKDRFRNSEVPLAEGAIDLALLRVLRRNAEYRLRSLVARSPLHGPVRRIVQGFRRWRTTGSAKKAESVG